MKAIIKNQSTIFGDKTIEVKEGVYKHTSKSGICCEEGSYDHYRWSIYVEVDNGCIEVVIGDQVFELRTGRDGHVGVNVLQNHAGEIVGLFV